MVLASKIDDDTTSVAQETTCLLPANNNSLGTAQKRRNATNNIIGGTSVMALATFLLCCCFLAAVFSTTRSRDALPLGMMMSSNTTTTTTTTTLIITFADLAESMVPAWYAQTVTAVAVFTSTITPDAVFQARKTLLKTRDLLDVFSPIYPTVVVDTDTNDLFLQIRKMLDAGYTIVGEFQDLDHANILYTEQELNDARHSVLDWKRDFDTLHRQQNVSAFLAAPSNTNTDLRSISFRHQSRFFWKGANNNDPFPSGSCPATVALQRLGSTQLERAVAALTVLVQYQTVLSASSHELYHNLRKQLRSVTDEYGLFGSIMFGGTPETEMAIAKLTRARVLLGDMNDDWAAYSFYVQHNNEYHQEQQERADSIEAAWIDFLQWTVEFDLQGAVHNLAVALNTTTTLLSVSSLTPNMNQFLEQRWKHPTRHIVVGNEAGDADSIISAMALAYVESSTSSSSSSSASSSSTLLQKTPVVSIPRGDFETQRPEVNLLLVLAGIDVDPLIFVDDASVLQDAVYVTLVDHNVLAESFQNETWTVVEIVDHHRDEGRYLDSCSDRNIAFAHGHAEAASACTLVAERMKELWKRPPYPASLGVPLLGVILLDSVNLSEDTGKVTDRDRDAVQFLLKDTDWQQLTERSRLALNITEDGPDVTVFFDLLQHAKFDPDFWASLSVRKALRLDYKEFSYKKHHTFGVSTVLLPLTEFLRKSDLTDSILLYMKEVDIEFLAVMSAFEDDGHFRRQLAICCANDNFPLRRMAKFLLESQSQLDLTLLDDDDPTITQGDTRLSILSFNQGNVKPSRKQIGPLLLEFFEAEARSY